MTPNTKRTQRLRGVCDGTGGSRPRFAWRLPSVDRQPGFPRFHRVVDTHTMNGCGEIVTINHVRRRASVMQLNLIRVRLTQFTFWALRTKAGSSALKRGASSKKGEWPIP